MPIMKRWTILPTITVVTVLALGSTLQAGHGQAIGRYIGVGWSDGYHSRTVCPPKRHMLHAAAPVPVMQAPPIKQVPWWMIPAADAENLPAPQDAKPGASGSGGTSLFRQPGEGSSNHPPASPSIMR
jgi:hypothetical protein